jgi:hypothetical protein
MKKTILLVAAGLLLGGAVFAKEDNGALGFGIMSESQQGALISNHLRIEGFLDVGYQLVGPIFYGFEFQGDVKKLDQSSFSVSQTDVTAFGLGGGDYILFTQTSQFDTTYTLWDLDFSPRGYLSFDLGDKIQLLGFAGINGNWQTLDVNTKVKNGTYPAPDGKTYSTGEEYKNSKSTDMTFTLLGGFRVSVGAFYVDYTRFLQANTTGDYSWNQFNKDRFAAGINLRF